MKLLLTTVTFILLSLPLAAQNLSISSPEVLVQTRAFHRTNAYDQGYFRTQADVGIGIRWNLPLNSVLNVSFGGLVNYGSFEKINRDNSALYYIDFYKSLEYHYFNLTSISQWNAELPISLRWSIKKAGPFKMGVFLGASPQFYVHGKSTGSGFYGTQTRTGFPNPEHFLIQNSNDSYRFLTDVYLNSGVFINKEILDGRSLILEAGYEYSTSGKSNGLLLRLGYGF